MFLISELTKADYISFSYCDPQLILKILSK
jgi:hypothetical protein